MYLSRSNIFVMFMLNPVMSDLTWLSIRKVLFDKQGMYALKDLQECGTCYFCIILVQKHPQLYQTTVELSVDGEDVYLDTHQHALF